MYNSIMGPTNNIKTSNFADGRIEVVQQRQKMKAWTSCRSGAQLLSANPPARTILEKLWRDREQGCANVGPVTDCGARIVVLALGL